MAPAWRVNSTPGRCSNEKKVSTPGSRKAATNSPAMVATSSTRTRPAGLATIHSTHRLTMTVTMIAATRDASPERPSSLAAA